MLKYGLPGPGNRSLVPLADSLLLTAGSASLAALLGLRIYGGLWAVPIQTPWDDALIRRDARIAARKETTARVVANALTPHVPALLGGRLNGYGDWLALGLKAGERIGSAHVQRTFQLVNVALLCVQGITVLLFGYWSTRDPPIAVALTFLYVSSPVVFGLNRWVLTENLVLTAGPALSLVAASLLAARAPASGRALRAAAVRAGAAAYLMGLLGYAREYASPSYGAIVAVVIASLVAQRRLAEAATFASVIACFAVPLAGPLVSALRAILFKATVSLYFHPLREFLPHVAVFVVGPSLTLVFLALYAAAAGRGLRRVRGSLRLPVSAAAFGGFLRRQLRSGLGALYWAHWLLLSLYVSGVVVSRNRAARSAIMPMLVTLGLLFLYLRRHPSARRWLRTTRARVAALCLVACSWSALAYQLFWAFEGGRTYAHAAFRLEYFNYPLGLRPLDRPGASHVCFDDCPYDPR